MEMSVEHLAGGVAVVRPSGRMDLLSSALVKQTFATEIAGGHGKLIVDLSAVTFVDSSGLGALVGGLKTARAGGGDLRIACVPELTRVVLELTTLDRVLKPFPTVEEALADL